MLYEMCIKKKKTGLLYCTLFPAFSKQHVYISVDFQIVHWLMWAQHTPDNSSLSEKSSTVKISLDTTLMLGDYAGDNGGESS